MITTLVEIEDEEPTVTSRQTLSLARNLATQTESPLDAVIVGDEHSGCGPALAEYGVSRVHLASGAALREFAPAAWAQSVVEVIERTAPRIVLAPGSERAQETMAHVAARTGLPFAANCTEVGFGSQLVVTRQRWGGSLLEHCEVIGPTALVTIALHSQPIDETVATTAEPLVLPFQPHLTEMDLRVRVRERVERDASSVSLADARVVVGGGRGVGSADNFHLLEEIADLLGGAVGCSRAVTSLGWRPHSDQVGQTGIRIAPDLYLACGISGAIQHMVGCKSAKCVVAINRDPEAPIMSLADYAIIGDVLEILPALRVALEPAPDQS